MPNAPEIQAQADQHEESGDEKFTITSAELSSLVNSAVTAQLKRAIAKELAPAVQSAIAPLREQFEKAQAKPQEQENGNAQGAKNPELLALTKQLEEMRAALSTAQEEKIAEQRRAREDRAFSELVTSLTGKVRPGTESMVAKLLKADGKLVVDEEQGPVLRVRASRHKGMPEEDLDFPIADGVSHYLKTKDAQVFLPSPNSGGAGQEGRVAPTSRQSGNRLPGYDKPPANADEAAARTMEQLEAMGISASVFDTLG